jgi:formylglycine-generating enzyme required for sulfatase activity
VKKFIVFSIALALASMLAACAPDLETLAQRVVTRNDEWTPVTRTFDGVEMVLVPAGCFPMGSEAETIFAPTTPVHEQCFEAPFWIDVTEVSNAQYGSHGEFSGPDQPRENVTWFEAAAHCASRGARLPTEAEWEYAARGPDGWAYPWGDSFVAENTVFAQTAVGETAAVGSRPAGASWVGVLDMAGNVSEWTHSINEPYPYDASDGREAEESAGTVLARHRILRGADYQSVAKDITLTNRVPLTPSASLEVYGFRCVRDYASP